MPSTILSFAVAEYMLFGVLGSLFLEIYVIKNTNKKVFIPEIIILTIICVIEFYLCKMDYRVAHVLHPLSDFFAVPLGTNLDAWNITSFK